MSVILVKCLGAFGYFFVVGGGGFCFFGLGFFFMVYPILCKLLKISPNLRCIKTSVDYPYRSSFKGNITQSVNIFSVTKKVWGSNTDQQRVYSKFFGKKSI